MAADPVLGEQALSIDVLGALIILVAVSDNSTDNSSNLSVNSLVPSLQDRRNKIHSRAFSVESRVFHIIDASEVELRPAEIARILHSDKKPKEITPGQYSTVRVVCKKLLDKGKVVQPYQGAYCNKITHTVRFVPLCVHNVTLLAKVCQNLKHWENDEFIGGIKIHVCFGAERKQVTGYIACDVGGMSHDACLLALNRWFEIVEGRLGIVCRIWFCRRLSLTRIIMAGALTAFNV